MSSFEEELLLDAAEDAKALQFIRQRLTEAENAKFTDDLLYYFIDLMVEYYAESGILDGVPDAEGFVDISLNEIAIYMADKAKKDKKPEKQKKPSIFARIGKWLKDMKSELKKVQWPSFKQTMNNTGIVILCVIVVGIFIWLFDAVAGALIEFLLGLFR